jgi:Fe-S cluster assembly protein SufD
MDDEALLYLRTRGMAGGAQGLLVYAFVQEMVDRIELELCEKLAKLVADWFGKRDRPVEPRSGMPG